MTGVLCALLGSSAVGDVQTVTAGFSAGKGGDDYGYVSGLMGSISDGTFNMLGGATIASLEWFTDGGSTNVFIFGLSGTYSNTGWTSVTVSGQTFYRSAATFSNSSGTTWSWSTSTNPFPTAGNNYVVTFA